MSKAAKIECEDTRLNRIEREVGEIRSRVFNGLASEIRKEMDQAIGGLRNLVVGILIALFLAMAGSIIADRASQASATAENTRNYKAIMELVDKLDDHVEQTKP